MELVVVSTERRTKVGICNETELFNRFELLNPLDEFAEELESQYRNEIEKSQPE